MKPDVPQLRCQLPAVSGVLVAVVDQVSSTVGSWRPRAPRSNFVRREEFCKAQQARGFSRSLCLNMQNMHGLHSYRCPVANRFPGSGLPSRMTQRPQKLQRLRLAADADQDLSNTGERDCTSSSSTSRWHFVGEATTITV